MNTAFNLNTYKDKKYEDTSPPPPLFDGLHPVPAALASVVVVSTIITISAPMLPISAAYYGGLWAVGTLTWFGLVDPKKL